MRKRPFIRLEAGRAWLRHTGYEVSLAAWPRRDPRMGEFTYRLNLHLWFTLPRLTFIWSR